MTSQKTGWKNKLYFGDNLDILREMDAESVDLIYLDRGTLKRCVNREGGVPSL